MADFTRNLEWRHRSLAAQSADVYTQVGVSGGTDTAVITHPILKINAAAGALTTFTVPNGEPGQILKIESVTSGNDVDVTPTTADGFTSIALDEIGDFCVLLYANDTIGWTILSTGALLAANTPVITQ